MKILVTGANGYIGTGVVNYLLNMGHEVVAVDSKNERIDRRALCYQENLFVDDFFEKNIIENTRPDAVLHLAWRDGFDHNSKSHFEDLNKHFMWLSRIAELGVKHIAVMGSVHEIGFFEGSVNETTPTNPQSLYGISKNALRQGLEIVCKKENIVFQWIRGFYIVGNAEYGSSVFSKIVQASRRGDKEFPFTKGINQFDFLNYDLFCSYLSKIVTQERINGIINCCSGFPQKIGDRVEEFIRENELNIKLKYGVFQERPYDSKAIWGNNSKLKEILATYET